MSEFTEFLLFKRKYEKLARDRKVERMSAVYDEVIERARVARGAAGAAV